MVLSDLILKIRSHATRVVHFAKFLNRKEFFMLYFSTTYAQAVRVLELCSNPLLSTKPIEYTT